MLLQAILWELGSLWHMHLLVDIRFCNVYSVSPPIRSRFIMDPKLPIAWLVVSCRSWLWLKNTAWHKRSTSHAQRWSWRHISRWARELWGNWGVWLVKFVQFAYSCDVSSGAEVYESSFICVQKCWLFHHSSLFSLFYLLIYLWTLSLITSLIYQFWCCPFAKRCLTLPWVFWHQDIS